MIAAIICGATATGKSEIAYKLARANGFEIISADSRQIYQGMDIGTGQVGPDWKKEVPHHFMGIVPPTQPYSVDRYRKEVTAFLGQNREKTFIVAGGTGLYIKALLYPQKKERKPVPEEIKIIAARKLQDLGSDAVYRELQKRDPEVAGNIHPHDRFRLSKAYENFLLTGKSYRDYGFKQEKHPMFERIPIIHIHIERSRLYKRINQKVEQMIEDGWIDEVRNLLRDNPGAELPGLNALGYSWIIDHVQGKTSIREVIAKIQQNTRNYAKKQVTFFKNQFSGARIMDYFQWSKTLESAQWKWTYEKEE
ncbi:tRNA (adenosine(37)-N6)-dimethylallyltransferase MiaA [Fibrobacterota bacterium]